MRRGYSAWCHVLSQHPPSETDICHKSNRRNAGEAPGAGRKRCAGFPPPSLVTEGDETAERVFDNGGYGW